MGFIEQERGDKNGRVMVGTLLDRTYRCGVFLDEYWSHGLPAGQGQKYG